MKILILGGSGLVGSTLAQSLKTENEIHVTFNTHNIDENFSKTQMNLLNDYEVQNEKVQNYKEFIESEQTKALDLISWVNNQQQEHYGQFQIFQACQNLQMIICSLKHHL